MTPPGVPTIIGSAPETGGEAGSTSAQSLFQAFSRLELSTGGPDPQVELIARAWSGAPANELAWLAGCFVGPYTCASAAAIWGNWRADDALARPDDLAEWLIENWEGIPIRRERRAVWKAEKLTECLVSYGTWARDVLPSVQRGTYEELYDSVRQHVKYFGRYATMKVLEVLVRQGLTLSGQTDIRPNGGKYPRMSLALLYPDSRHNFKPNDRTALAHANSLAHGACELIGGQSWFKTETLLCNFRQALDGKYPGRSHDRELAHWRKAETYWDFPLLDWLPFYELRARLFPAECLGEQHDWDGARKELEQVFADHGYFWCDTAFSYRATNDFAAPVTR